MRFCRVDGDGRQRELQSDAAYVFHQIWASAYLSESTADEMNSKTREVTELFNLLVHFPIFHLLILARRLTHE